MAKRTKLTQKTFSSGQVADLIGVSSRTANRMMIAVGDSEDSTEESAEILKKGFIPCFRIPTSNYRRVTRANLVRYFRARGMIEQLREIGEPR